MLNEIPKSTTDDSPFLSVKESASLARSTEGTFYVNLCRKRFPQHLYIRFGRKVLFIKKHFIEWLMSGAQFE